ncbi:MAG: lipid-A-disaccharide synthase [Deltaproteobacteria bacterium]|nr:lipid-A-disaccharide synthase [Deltaproteobacteria bacterium]
MNEQPLRVLISVGELSADEHAALVVASLRRLLPQAEFKAMGGRKLREAGVDTVVDSEHSASVMGFSEVFGSLRKVMAALSDLKKTINDWRPHLVMVLDYPDFNFRLIRFAKQKGCKVLYFIPPQVWAWRSGRVEFLKRFTDRIACIFPFEKPFLISKGYNRVEFVGHPLLDSGTFSPCNMEQRSTLKRSLGLDPLKPLVAVFPGSRRTEIERHVAPMTAAIAKLQNKYPDVQAVINIAPSIDEDAVRQRVVPGCKLLVVKRPPHEVMQACDAAVLKSGTSNLQAAICEVPFVMFYIASDVSAWIVKRFVRLKEFSMVNILKSGSVRELTQKEANADLLASELESLIYNGTRRAAMINDFREIKSLLSTSPQSDPKDSSYDRVALLARDLLTGNEPLLKTSSGNCTHS